MKQEENKENKTTQSSNEVEQAVSKIFVYTYILHTDRNQNLAHDCV